MTLPLLLTGLLSLLLGAAAAFILLRLRGPAQGGQEAAAVLQAKLDASAEERGRLASELDAAKSQLEASRKEASALEADKARRDSELKGLIIELERVRAEAHESRAKAVEQEARLLEADKAVSSFSERLKYATQSLEELKAEALRLRDELKRESDAKAAALSDASKLKAEHAAVSKLLESQEAGMKGLQESSRKEFEAIASKLLEEKGEKFTKLHGERLGELLNPLRENLGEFKKRIEDVYEKESKDRSALERQVQLLAEMNRRVGDDANKLALALKGEAKVMGDWGEVLLDRILEGSGLVKGEEYFKQESVRDSDGSLLRPDVVIRLPQGKSVVVDSKVSIAAYADYCNASDEPARQEALDRHVKSLRAHIDELAAKSYQSHVDGTLDFVVMFVPNEPAYLLAMKFNDSLWEYAYKRKIVLSSPTNLFAVLKIASELWRKDKESKGYLEIADCGASIYDKLVVFLGFMEDLGGSLDKARASYDKALNNLKDGRGNLIGRAQRMTELGLKTKSQMEGHWLDGRQPAEAPADAKDDAPLELKP